MVGGALPRCYCVRCGIIGTAQKKKEKKKRKAKSSSIVPLSQLPSTSGVIATLASSTPVCAVTYAVAVVEQPRKWKGDGSCRTCKVLGKFPGLVGFREVYASAGKSCATWPLLINLTVDP